MCVDYRGVNRVTKCSRLLLPNIEERFDAMAGATVYSVLDHKSGNHQIRVANCDILKTGFVSHLGHFEFVCAPFGQRDLPGQFSKLTYAIFKDLIGKTVQVYLDDIIIFSRNQNDHVSDLQ